MNAKTMKKINAKVQEFCMALLKEQLSDTEAAKVTKKSVVKAEYATNNSYHYAIALSSKGMKSIIKRLLKTKQLDVITLDDVKEYCAQTGRG
tara:strand:- start:2186 stop:2461 length:276 start_codon:yes stop_codon:yes gene_type:complete